MNASGKALACVAGDISLVRALGRSGIPVAVAAAPDSPLRRSRYCAELVPTPSWVESPDAALDALIAWGRDQRDAPVLFYQGDHDLLAVSRGRSRLAPHLRCVLPPADLVEDLGDKVRFAALAARLRLPVPVTLTLKRGPDLAGMLQHWADFPCVLKPNTRSPRFAEVSQRQKAIRVENRRELDAHRALIESYDSDFVLQAAVEGGEERIESYHAYVRPGGQVMGEFTGRKVRTLPRLFGHSTYVEITDEADVRNLGRSILEKIAFSGVAKVDFKRDARTGRLFLLEINARFSLWHHPGAAAGVSIPALVYRDCVEPGTARPAGPARAGVRWASLRDDFRAFKEYRAAGEVSLFRWLVQAASADINESFMFRDPIPGLAGLGGSVRRRVARLLGRRPAQPVANPP
ncbi:MAG TPA: ATP-grasp domain-containing protein [Planctomycetota bacterium]|nr:ATP-grasp domain-containing protein [Planctomycetota bacterium]